MIPTWGDIARWEEREAEERRRHLARFRRTYALLNTWARLDRMRGVA